MPSFHQAVHAINNPLSIVNYSDVVRTGSILYLAVSNGDEPATSQILSEDIQAQIEQAIFNIKYVIEAADPSFDAIHHFRKIDAV